MKKKKNNQYFTEVHEKAIIDYISSNDWKYRNELYLTIIRPVLIKIIDKIVLTYKFTKLPNIEILKADCEVHLAQVLSNFDKDRGYKAFSYFSVITKNWFTHKAKKTSYQSRYESYYDEIPNSVEQEFLSIENTYLEDRQKEEFFIQLWKELDNWSDQDLKENELRVLKAIKILFEDAEIIPNFNKKAVNIYLREKTGLNTKQLQGNLKKFKRLYFEYKNKWENEE